VQILRAMPRRTGATVAALLIEPASGLFALSGYFKPRGAVYFSDTAPTDELDLGLEAVDGGPLDSVDLENSPEPPDRFDVKSLAGISAPLGFFDPLGFSTDASEGKIRFFREVELKHCRVAMLAALGFAVAEPFHPLFGGEIDVPSYIAFQETPLQSFWPLVVLCIAVPEIFSVFSFQSPFGGELWSIRSDHLPGDIGFDPLNLKPRGAAELKEMETKELNNGRLAMLGIAGMVAQELATGNTLF